MKIDKSMLQKIKSVCFILENCDEYEVPAEQILDFDAPKLCEHKRFKEEKYSIDDGRIVISKAAFNILYNDHQCGARYNEEDYLVGRLLSCCDICAVLVKFKDGGDLIIRVPYDTLESIQSGAEVDMSNCPSAELDANGDLLILFGASSRAYKRTDNNYFDLIEGLSDKFESLADPLIVRLDGFRNFVCDGEMISVDVRVVNDRRVGAEIGLVFGGVSDVGYDVFFRVKNRRLLMSRVSTGKIFVQIEGFCTFYCLSAMTYDAWLNSDHGDDQARGN